jgi:hypothetical protein
MNIKSLQRVEDFFMSIYVLKRYVEECLKKGINPTFEGLKIYNKKAIF